MPKSKKDGKKVNKKTKTNSKSSFLFKYRLHVAVVMFAFVGAVYVFSSFAATSLKPVTPNSRFTWLLQGTPNPSIMDSESGPKVYDFDYLNSSPSQIAAMKAKGITTICYFSAGTDEDWRPDHSQFKAGDTFGQLPGWEGELIVDTRSANVRQIMYNRIQTMSNYGCDGIEPDNIDAYTNSSSIPLNETTTLDYMQFLTDTAHSFNMTVALKNAGDLINKKLPNGKTVLQAHDFAVVEQCYEYSECDAFLPFIAANKAVFIVEYKGTSSTWAASSQCKDANAKNFDAYLMNLNLNGPRTACRTSGGSTATPTPPSNSPPAIGITSPTNNQSFASGASISFAANASDNDGTIKQVQFFVGNASFGVDASAPYSTNITGLAPGTYTLTAIATDNTSTNNNTATASVTVKIVAPSDPAPTANINPVVNLQTPPATINAPASFNLAASASDSDGNVVKVEFYAGSSKIGEDTTSPYSFAIANYQAGSYTFSAKATDNAGATTISPAKTVIVTTTTTTPTPTPSPTPTPTPGTSSSAPTWPTDARMTKGWDTSWWKNNCAFKSTCGIYVHWPQSTDNVRIVGYELWRKTNNTEYVKLYVNDSWDRYWSDRINKTDTYTYKVFAVDNEGNRTEGPSRSVKIQCTLGYCSL